MHEESNFLQRQETIEINADQKVIVCGAGGIGFHVAKMLVMNGVREIIVFDDDVFEAHNLNRIDIPVEFIGKNKAQTVERMAKMMRPNANIKGFHYRISPGLIDADTDVFIDCTDEFAVQQKNKEVCDEKGIDWFKAGYDGLQMSINSELPSWDTGDTPDGYQITPSMCMPAIMIACLAVARVLKYPGKEFSSDIEGVFTR